MLGSKKGGCEGVLASGHSWRAGHSVGEIFLLEVKDPEVLVTDALCEQTDVTPKENRVHLVCDKNTDALRCDRRQKPSL